MTSSTPTTHILISGAGIAGLALALQLVRGGIRTTIVEQAAGPRPGGQAVDLRGASRDVAGRMGLTEAIEPYRVHEKGLSYVDGRGRVFGRMSMEAFDGKGAVAEVEIARGDLAAVLRRELVAAANGLLDLRYGDRIIAVSQDESGVDVRFEHADAARFDVVVGTDGVHSSTRRLVFGGEEQFRTYLGGYAAFFTLPTPDDIEEGWFSMRFTPGTTFGIRPDLDPATAKAMLTLRIDRDPALRGDLAAQKELIRRALHGAGWHADTILAAMDAADDFYFDELVRIDVPNPVSGRVVLIGDAGSSGSPQAAATSTARSPDSRKMSHRSPRTARPSWAAASSAWFPRLGFRPPCCAQAWGSCSHARCVRLYGGCSRPPRRTCRCPSERRVRRAFTVRTRSPTTTASARTKAWTGSGSHSIRALRPSSRLAKDPRRMGSAGVFSVDGCAATRAR